MAEVYVCLPNFSNYQISNFGNFKNLTTLEIKKPNVRSVLFRQNGITASSPVINLVAEAFVDNPHHGYKVECIDGNIDNAMSTNLRWALRKNCATRKANTNNTSGFVGVRYVGKENMWVAVITVNKKTIYLGYFAVKEDAIRARQEAEILHFQECRAV